MSQGKVISLAEKRAEKRGVTTPARTDLYRVLQQMIMASNGVQNKRHVMFFVSDAMYLLTNTRVLFVDSKLVEAVTEENSNRRDAFRDEEMRYLTTNHSENLFYIKAALGEITIEKDRLFAAELFMIMCGILRAHKEQDRLP